ncbi:MAG TPA: hypothetical protein VKB31_00845 [Trueperaceae bacterium]|nr:hypothetical protein [Trueperaceae bacterium]
MLATEDLPADLFGMQPADSPPERGASTHRAGTSARRETEAEPSPARSANASRARGPAPATPDPPPTAAGEAGADAADDLADDAAAGAPSGRRPARAPRPTRRGADTDDLRSALLGAGGSAEEMPEAVRDTVSAIEELFPGSLLALTPRDADDDDGADDGADDEEPGGPAAEATADEDADEVDEGGDDPAPHRPGGDEPGLGFVDPPPGHEEMR